MVVDYQTTFEKLGTQVVGLSQEAILNCFISGLTPDIQNEIAILKPTSISQAIGLAKLIESKIKDSKPKFHKHFSNPIPKSNPAPPISTTPPTAPKTNPSISTIKFPIHRLSNTQLQERHAQGLCFNYDEKFITGHKCSSGKFLLPLINDEDTTKTNFVSDQPVCDNLFEMEDTYFQLSPQAANGYFSPKTLKFSASIQGLTVTVLIDTGSTHNILQPMIAQHLKLPTNGSKFSSSGICSQVPITLQNHTFTIPFHLIPIEGADVILGMEWLRTLGLLLADFSIPKLSFTYQNNEITLTDDLKTLPSHSSYNQICCLEAPLHPFTYYYTNPRTVTSIPTTKLPILNLLS